MSNYCCPKCKSSSVHRSGRRGLFENLALRLFMLRPYRCWSCGNRYYGYILLHKHRGSRGYATTSASLLYQLPKAVPLLPLLLVVPWALASTGSDLMLLGLASSPRVEVAPEADSFPASSNPYYASVEEARQTAALYTENDTSAQITLVAAIQNQSTRTPERAPNRTAPTTQNTLGTITSTGDVTLNGAQVPQMATVYSGDSIATGPGGNAVVRLQGLGQLDISPETSVNFPVSPRYLAQLEHGQMNLRSLPLIQDLRVRAGNLIIEPVPANTGAMVSITKDSTGLTRFRALEGSAKISELGGVQSVTLQGGQQMSFAPGQGFGPTPPASSPSVAAASGSSRTPLILAGVGAGVAGGVAAAVAGGGGDSGGSTPVSPFRP